VQPAGGARRDDIERGPRARRLRHLARPGRRPPLPRVVQLCSQRVVQPPGGPPQRRVVQFSRQVVGKSECCVQSLPGLLRCVGLGGNSGAGAPGNGFGHSAGLKPDPYSSNFRYAFPDGLLQCGCPLAQFGCLRRRADRDDQRSALQRAVRRRQGTRARYSFLADAGNDRRNAIEQSSLLDEARQGACRQCFAGRLAVGCHRGAAPRIGAITAEQGGRGSSWGRARSDGGCISADYRR